MQLQTPQAWPVRSERTVIVRGDPRELRCSALWFLVGAILVLGPVVAWRWRVIRPVAAAHAAAVPSGVVFHPSNTRMWIDGVRVDAASVALSCGVHSIRAEAAHAPILVDVTCAEKLRP
jgi:hypothetical protein